MFQSKKRNLQLIVGIVLMAMLFIYANENSTSCDVTCDTPGEAMYDVRDTWSCSYKWDGEETQTMTIKCTGGDNSGSFTSSKEGNGRYEVDYDYLTLTFDSGMIFTGKFESKDRVTGTTKSADGKKSGIFTLNRS